MKKTLRVILSLALVLVLSLGCGAAALAAGEAAPAEEAPAFDLDLVGQWVRFDTQNNGNFDSIVIDLLRSMDIILPNGVFSEGGSFDVINAAGGDQLTGTAADGKTDLGEHLVDFVLALGGIEDLDMNESYVEEAKKLSNLEISYEFFDFNPEDVSWIHLTDARKALFQKATDDGLRLHVTGKYKQDPLSTKTIDVTYCYYADLPSYYFYEALFCGDWTDQNGNSWHFGYEFEEDSSTKFAFKMTTEDGDEYVGESLYARTDLLEESQVKHIVSFTFEDFESPDYELTELDENTITLISEDGDLILTRA